MDATLIAAISGLLLGALSGGAQLVKIYKDYKNADKRLPAQTKLDESLYARNATETANLATDARLKLEEHTIVLDKRIADLEKALDKLQTSIDKLNRKNTRLLKAIGELLSGIKILLDQLKALEITPEWVPKKTLESVIIEQNAIDKE